MRPDISFTMIDIIRALGFEPTKDLDWSIGKEAQQVYQRQYGVPPVKDLRSKTGYSQGSHCFAIYPPEFRATAEAIVSRVAEEIKAARAAQGDLFDGYR